MAPQPANAAACISQRRKGEGGPSSINGLSGRRFLWELFNRFPNEFEITANVAFQLIREMAGNLGGSFFNLGTGK
jgi:hypothetical protein